MKVFNKKKYLSVMEKTETMKKFEERTGKQAIYWTAFGPEISQEYIDEIEARYEAYDRVMSMNSISENDIQIVLDGNAWCAYRLPFRNLQEDDAGFGDTPQMALTALLESERPEERCENCAYHVGIEGKTGHVRCTKRNQTRSIDDYCFHYKSESDAKALESVGIAILETTLQGNHITIEGANHGNRLTRHST